MRGGVIPKLFDWIYPIGSVIANSNVAFDPNTVYKHQTWERIAEGRVLMGADEDHEVGTTVEAGLPNIVGSIRPAVKAGGYPLIVDSASGAFSKNDSNGYNASTTGVNTDSRYRGSWIKLNASLSNPIYGNSDTVQPPAYFVYYWKRTA